eukprot:scaffold76430_cov64-Phaeocystis_antarctica.AAC.5
MAKVSTREAGPAYPSAHAALPRPEDTLPPALIASQPTALTGERRHARRAWPRALTEAAWPQSGPPRRRGSGGASSSRRRDRAAPRAAPAASHRPQRRPRMC